MQKKEKEILKEENKMKLTKGQKGYSIIKSKEWFNEKNMNFLKPKSFIVVRHNMKNWTMNPTKYVTSINEGIKYIKSKKGFYFNLEE